MIKTQRKYISSFYITLCICIVFSFNIMNANVDKLDYQNNTQIIKITGIKELYKDNASIKFTINNYTQDQVTFKINLEKFDSTVVYSNSNMIDKILFEWYTVLNDILNQKSEMFYNYKKKSHKIKGKSKKSFIWKPIKGFSINMLNNYHSGKFKLVFNFEFKDKKLNHSQIIEYIVI